MCVSLACNCTSIDGVYSKCALYTEHQRKKGALHSRHTAQYPFCIQYFSFYAGLFNVCNAFSILQMFRITHFCSFHCRCAFYASTHTHTHTHKRFKCYCCCSFNDRLPFVHFLPAIVIAMCIQCLISRFRTSHAHQYTRKRKYATTTKTTNHENNPACVCVYWFACMFVEQATDFFKLKKRKNQ